MMVLMLMVRLAVLWSCAWSPPQSRWSAPASPPRYVAYLVQKACVRFALQCLLGSAWWLSCNHVLTPTVESYLAAGVCCG